jgi:DNA-binding transcriptional regulator YiaG
MSRFKTRPQNLKALKLTQQQPADLIGAQRFTIARWELGWSAPTGANLKMLTQLEK